MSQDTAQIIKDLEDKVAFYHNQSLKDVALRVNAEKRSRPLVYLASPYSHQYQSVRRLRFVKAARAAATLTAQGVIVFSPITHSHPMVTYLDALKEDTVVWEKWKAIDTAFMSCCHKLVVLKLEGWDQSVGVTAEIEIAKQMGIPVEYMEAV